MKTRLKKIRLAKSLSQEDFGRRLGVTKSTISNIENGRFNATDTMIKLICSEFSVNEEWLRTGAGGDENMFISADANHMNLGKSVRTPNEFRDFLVQLMQTLPDEYCNYLYEEFRNFEASRSQNRFAGIPDTPEELEELYPPIKSDDDKVG